MEPLAGNLYDYPKYYDLVFGSDCQAEFQFLRAAFKRYARREVKRVFEPACGTGRLLIRLAKTGYGAAGLDLNAKAVEYCNRRFERAGFSPPAMVEDMSRFRLRPAADAAFNMIGSFRHLPDEAAAHGHLQCMAAALRKGGIYVLGLHLTPTQGQPLDEETWSGRRGHLAVVSHLWTIGRDARRRKETVGTRYDIYTPTRQFQISGEIVFRTYTARQMESLIARTPEFETAATHDFSYDIDRPIKINAATEDVVYVLRKK